MFSMHSESNAKILWKFFNCKFLEEGIGLISLDQVSTLMVAKKQD